MKRDDLKSAYHNFFNQSEAGRYFVETMKKSIELHQLQAEDHPEMSRDLMQRVGGMRAALSHIQSVVTDPKKIGRAASE